MTQIRPIWAFIILGVASGLIAGRLADGFNLNFYLTLMVLQSGLNMLLYWLARKYSWWDKVDTSGISENSLQKILLQALIGVTIMAYLRLLPLLSGDEKLGDGGVTTSIYYLVLLWMIIVVMRFTTWKAAARKNPALRDERMRLNVQKSQKWALISGMTAAAILPFVDQQGWLAVSGKAVGLMVVFTGMIAFLATLLWLEVKDG